MTIIGFRRNIRNEFFKSLFHGYLILLILLASASVVLAIVLGGNLDGFQFLNLVIWYIVWSVLIFLFPMSIVLFFIRKVKANKYRRMGYAMAIVLFAVAFHICHYFIFRKLAGPLQQRPLLRFIELYHLFGLTINRMSYYNFESHDLASSLNMINFVPISP